MRIAIIGAGSIGCYVGGRLAAAGEDVVFVGRQRMATPSRAPINARIVKLIGEAEERREGSPGLSAGELKAALSVA